MTIDHATLAHDQTQSLRTSPTKQPSSKIFYGWWVVLASAFGLLWGVPISVYSFSVFFKPLMHEFHASRAAVSAAYTVKLIAAALCAAPIGWLTDHYGARRVSLTGTVIFGSTCLQIGCFPAPSLSFTAFTFSWLLRRWPWSNTLWVLGVAWFDRFRGMALGLKMLGIGLGAVIMPTVAQTLIARFGWRAHIRYSVH